MNTQTTVTNRYLDMSDPNYLMVENLIYESFENACILWIEKNNNSDLLSQCSAYIKTLAQPNIKLLFHGTSEPIARKIMKEGFDPSYNKSSCFGNGVYFSPLAQTSQWYSKTAEDEITFMLVNEVAVGRSCPGKYNSNIPKGFNSAVDCLNNPNEIIVNKKEAAYPKYLVAFYRDSTVPFGQSILTKTNTKR